MYLRALAILLLLLAPAAARDNGQFSDVPDTIRQWFKSVLSPSGIPCCDIADGHRTTYEMHGGNYWVPIDGTLIEVPGDVIVRNAGNPIGEAIVWYYRRDGAVIIRCFIPASEV